jgi:small-conductance mechanosensitive channel
MIKLFRALLLLLVFIAAPALAQDEGPKLANADALLKTWEADAAEVDNLLEVNWQGSNEDEKRRALIDRHRAEARILADKARAAVVPIQAQLDALGPGPKEGETEDPGVASQRAELQKQIDDVRAIGSKAELAFTRADRLLERIATARRRQFSDQLMTRGPTPLAPGNWIEAGESAVATSTKILGEVRGKEKAESRQRIWRESGAIALAALLFALVIMVVARRAALQWLYRILGTWIPLAPNANEGSEGTDISSLPSSTESESIQAAKSRTTRLMVGIGVTLTRLATPLLALFAAQFALDKLQIFGEVGTTVLNGLVAGATILAIGYAIVFAFFAPQEPRLRLSLLDNKMSRSAARYSMLIALAMALNEALVNVGQQLGWPLGALAVVNAGIIFGGSVALWRLARVAAKGDAADELTTLDAASSEESEQWLSLGAGRIVRRMAYAVSIAAPLLALAGYFALSRYVFYGALLSGAVVAAGVLLFSVAKEGTSALSEATRDSKNEKKIDEDDKEGGLLPVFVGFVLILLALPILALIWGATRDDLGEVYFALTNGFTIGDSTFRPGDILIAAIVFGAGLFLTRIVQAIMRRTVMPRTRLDTGARSSIVSGLGYVGFFVAVLVAISAGGLDLTNLAFLGAALGVGIGFGLQNIVNNFVSGIILLIERPIKVGDWIEVAGTHGIVQKVNVRSTEIKTFDKASYIVPNSELISGAVMNMTHGDLMGRVIAPVGVAYGTDTRKVEKILLEILRAHPMVLRNPPPQVVFKGFGADSLDFEARGFLRDVNWILATHSDLNFEIDRRFREENVEIPFKQTDVNLKNANALVEAISAVTASNITPRAPSRRPTEGTLGDADGD